MALWRPFRRQNRGLGTLGGNRSELDDVNAEGPPVFGPSVGGVVEGLAYWNQERETAAHVDLAQDTVSDFAAATDAENATWDHLGNSGADHLQAQTQPPDEPDDFNVE
jgi:hypothetical protein